MILLRAVSKMYVAADAPPKAVFRPTTIVLPTDRRVAILGDRLQGKTTLLRLLAGSEAPDKGEVIAPLALSPIANSRTLFHPRLTGKENLRVVARMIGVDADRLAFTTAAFCGMGKEIDRPIYKMSGPERQLLELALLSVLSFGCYLLDNAHSVPPKVLECYFNAAARRGAGAIFATIAPRQVYEYADYAVVIRDGTVRGFNQIEEAVQSYER